MNYQIIKDKQLLIDFIEWLPDLEDNEVFYIALFGRKKYAPELKFSKTDKTQIKRLTSTKNRLADKIKQLECEVGSYFLKDTEAPQKSLAIYITVNPRDQILASKNMLIKLARIVTQPYNGHNLHQEALSEIQKAKSRTCWVDFDIDCNKDEISLSHMVDELNNILTPTSYRILETHGGFHILVNPKAQLNKFWYNEIKLTFDCDVVGDNMLPIIGCTQGNFIPHFVY